MDGIGDGSGGGNEKSNGNRNGDGDRNVNRNNDEIREGGGDVKTGRNRTRVLDAIRHFYSARAIISADKGWLLRTPDGSARKACCLYT